MYENKIVLENKESLGKLYWINLGVAIACLFCFLEARASVPKTNPKALNPKLEKRIDKWIEDTEQDSNDHLKELNKKIKRDIEKVDFDRKEYYCYLDRELSLTPEQTEQLKCSNCNANLKRQIDHLKRLLKHERDHSQAFVSVNKTLLKEISELSD